MLDFIHNLTLLESEKRANEEIGKAIADINEVYKEWKKRGRRKNAASLVTFSINKLANIAKSAAIVTYLHDAAKTKLAVILMRCMDLPAWADVDTKRIPYRRLYPLLDKLQRISPNTTTGGNLSDILTTRLSASITNAAEGKARNVFVSYEPTMNKRYLSFIFGAEMPEHIAKMQTLSLPEDYDTLLNIIKINHTKACDKYNGNSEKDNG